MRPEKLGSEKWDVEVGLDRNAVGGGCWRESWVEGIFYSGWFILGGFPSQKRAIFTNIIAKNTLFSHSS